MDLDKVLGNLRELDVSQISDKSHFTEGVSELVELPSASDIGNSFVSFEELDTSDAMSSMQSIFTISFFYHCESTVLTLLNDHFYDKIKVSQQWILLAPLAHKEIGEIPVSTTWRPLMTCLTRHTTSQSVILQVWQIWKVLMRLNLLMAR